MKTVRQVMPHSQSQCSGSVPCVVNVSTGPTIFSRKLGLYRSSEALGSGGLMDLSGFADARPNPAAHDVVFNFRER